MGRVLAIEPEATKAEALRQLIRNDVGAEFVLVTSAYAAVVAINRQLPDLVLFSESISDRHRERVVDHLKSVSRSGTPPTLSIPALLNGDRAAYASQIGASLGKAKGKTNGAATAAASSVVAAAARPTAPVAAKPSPAPAPQRPVVEAAAPESIQSSSNCFHRHLPSKPWTMTIRRSSARLAPAQRRSLRTI